MSPRKRVVLLICIMATTCIVAESIAIGLLYRTALQEASERLEETAKSRARLIESIARFDAIYSTDYPHGATEATLSQIADAHDRFQGFGETGEFTLSRREGDLIVFLLRHRHDEHQTPKPIPFDSELAEPMRLALLGKSGTIIGLDYRGKRVFAAYEPVQELDLGIVAKIDLEEIQAPFVKAAVISGLFAVVAVALGAASFIRVTNPLLKRLSETIDHLQDALKKVKTLRGFLPICASCKKIRDDRGYWKEIEVYIGERSEVDFSHGICQECLKKIHPDRDRFAENE
jgi:hypothetical protein